MDASRSPVGTVWSDVLTAAVNLPADYPGRERIIAALDAAAYTATKTVAAMFSDQWYIRALASIRAEDEATARQILAMVTTAYSAAHKQLVHPRTSVNHLR